VTLKGRASCGNTTSPRGGFEVARVMDKPVIGVVGVSREEDVI
jgi:hypothetical protein